MILQIEWDCSEDGTGRGAIEDSLHIMAQGMTLSGALGIPGSRMLTGRMNDIQQNTVPCMDILNIPPLTD